MAAPSDHLLVLSACYSVVDSPKRIQTLGGAGGFSGARFWRVETEGGIFCLRRWPAGYPEPRDLEFIHGVLRHAAERGFSMAPVPLETRGGQTWVSHGGYLWEMSPWVAGRADFSQRPTVARLQAAMVCLARFHRAIEGFRPPRPPTTDHFFLGSGRSPTIPQRIELLQEWMCQRAQRLEQRLARPTSWPEMGRHAQRLLSLLPDAAPVVYEDLVRVRDSSVLLQPCLRDVWHDHVFFDGDRVSGLIDFGSMRFDNVSCDVARLLGSLAASDRSLWAAGLSSYEAIRPLSKAEHGLMNAFDRSGALLAPLNWINWTLLEGRVFEEPALVLQRMDALMTRLARTRFSHTRQNALIM